MRPLILCLVAMWSLSCSTCGAGASGPKARIEAGLTAADAGTRVDAGPCAHTPEDGGPPPGTCCEITLNDCPNQSGYGTWTGKDPLRSPSTQSECTARAQDYLSWCGAQLPVSATWWSEGRLVAQRVASSLDGKASTELLPAEAAGLTNPLIRFGNGKVAAGAPDLYPAYPRIAGFGPTSWFITQWKKRDHMEAGLVSELSNSTHDPVLGLAKYAFSTRQYLSHAWFYPDPTDVSGKGLVFELFSTGGLYDSAGGSGQHFSTYLQPPATLDAPVILSFNGKLKRRAATYLVPNPNLSHVVGIWYSLFTATYVDPVAKTYTHAFVQILHGDTRDRAIVRHVEFYSFYDNTPSTVNYVNLLAEDSSQYFSEASPTGALRPVEFDVSKYICDMLKTGIPRADGTVYTFPPAALNLSNWKLSSFATGIETSDTMLLDAAGNTRAEGNVEISYQISNVHLRKYPGLSRTYAGCTF